ncbi:MAG: CopY/TcrY family copper transport repressor [Lactobacillales bacterium]|jgi:CopY/TcrY family copper transport repressor|nr:CopY/TcrY family copper transport repressor [Lactobacillales bacterium]
MVTQEVHTYANISDSEWEIMRVIWTLGEATSTEINAILADSMGWKLATVKTLLGRLVKKQALSTERVGKKFVYRPLVSEDESMYSASSELFKHICAKKVGKTLAEIVADIRLTKEDIALIQTALNQNQPVATIACNCIPGQCHCKHHEC